jgi:antitoxin component of MazEF toxin-antitoxin module
MKSIYMIQPYHVGSKGRSLALIIPADVARKYDISPSTVFALSMDADAVRIVLQQTEYDEKRENQKQTTPTEQPFHRSTQQAGRTQ